MTQFPSYRPPPPPDAWPPPPPTTPRRPPPPPPGAWPPLEPPTAELPRIPRSPDPARRIGPPPTQPIPRQRRPNPTPTRRNPSAPPPPTTTRRRRQAETSFIKLKGILATLGIILTIILFVLALLWGLNWLHDKSQKDKYNDYGLTTTHTDSPTRYPAADPTP